MSQARPGPDPSDRLGLGGPWSAGQYLRAGLMIVALGFLGLLAILVIGGILALAIVTSAVLWLGLRFSQRRSSTFRPVGGSTTGPVIETSYRVVDDHGRDASSGP